MRCPHCGYDNRVGAQFCGACGTALAGGEAHNPHPLTQPLAPAVTRRLAADLPVETRPLSEAGAAFAPLPEGALLQDGRYVVLDVRSADDRVNVYLVEDTHPVRVCPNCEAEMADPDEDFCAACGADLAAAALRHLHCLVTESADAQAFETEARLVALGLEHPALLLPHAVFSEAPYGPPRRYLVEPEFPSPLATPVPVPQRLARVVEWGVWLAEALERLHLHHVTLRGDCASHLMMDGGIVMWTRLGEATVLSPEARLEAPTYVAQDVRGLAGALFYLATARPEYTSENDLPEPAVAFFAQALASPPGFDETPEIADAATFRAALETLLEELRRPAGVTLTVGYRTDVGQERSLNEDSLLTLEMAQVYRSLNTPVGLFAVADGMGGHEAGDVASELAIRAVAQRAVADVMRPVAVGESVPPSDEWLVGAVEAANRAVYEKRTAAGTDMGTTLVVALVIGDTARVANVGDSRAYLLNGDEMAQVSTDHSLIERLVATGQITPQEAVTHPQRNVIYRVIGDKPGVRVDLFDLRLAPGEALLLCSDGLSGMVPDDEIRQIWTSSVSPQDACDRLVAAANEGGGEDNITALIVRVGA